MAFFGVNFILQNSCPCKKNDKYQVCNWDNVLFRCWCFEVAAWSRLWRWNLIKICLRTCDMTKRSYFSNQNLIPHCAFGNVLFQTQTTNQQFSWNHTKSDISESACICQMSSGIPAAIIPRLHRTTSSKKENIKIFMKIWMILMKHFWGFIWNKGDKKC